MSISRIQCSIPLWVRLVVLWAVALFFGGDAFAQTLYKTDSASNVWSKLVGTLGSGTAAPTQIRVLTGDGAKFAKVGVPLLIKISPWGRASGYQDTAHYELDSVSAISGDTLTISKRALSNSYQLSWTAGARIEVAFDFPLVKQLQDKVTSGLAGILPSQTGNNGKVLGTNGSSVSWVTNGSSGAVTSFNTRTGAVLPVAGDYNFNQLNGSATVAQGGTGLTGIALNKLIWAKTVNVFAPLSAGTGLTFGGTDSMNVTLAPFTTTNLAEGSNLYYTDARARLALTATAPVLLNSSTGVISESQATVSTNGWLSSTDWTTFNNKQAALTFPLSVANGGTGATSLGPIFTTVFGDTAGHAGQALAHTAGGGWGYIAAGGAGSGTVTSVAATVPTALLTVSGSPITTSGTLAITATATDSAKVWIGPASGGSATPTFRLLQSTDIPNLSAAQITSGVMPVANGGTGQSTYTNGQILIGNTTGNTLAKATITGTANQVVVTNGSGTITLSTPQSIATTSTPTFSSLTLTNPLTVANGGTGATTLASNGILFGNGTGAVSVTSANANSILLTNGSSIPSLSTTLPTQVQQNITTLGTIGTGVWNGTAVVVTYGGTGATTLASNGVLYGNGTSAVQALAVNASATNKFLTQSSSAAPAWATIVAGDVPTLNQNTTGSAATLTTPRAIYGNNFDGSADLTQIIASTYGGTGNGFTKFTGPTTSEKTFTLPNASATLAYLAGGQTFTGGLTINGGLTLGTALSVASGGTNSATALSGSSIMISNGSAIVQGAAGTATTLLHGNASGAPTYSAVVSGDITDGTIVNADIANTTIDLTAKVTGVLPIANGGTNQSTYTAGDILYSDATNSLAKLPIGASTTVLHGGTTPSYSAVNLATDVTGSIGVANGGTGSASLKAHDLLAGNGTNAIDTIPSLSAGRTLISNGTGFYPTMQVQTSAGALIVRDTVAANGTGSSSISKNLFEPGLGSGIPMFGTLQFVSVRSATTMQYMSLDSSATATKIGWVIISGGTFASAQQEGVNVLAVGNSPNGAIYGAQNYLVNPTTQSQVKDTIVDAAIQDSSIVFANTIEAAGGSTYGCDIRSIASGKIVLNVINANTRSNITSGTTLTTSYLVVNSTPDGRIVTGKFYLKNTGSNMSAKDTSFDILTGDVPDTNVTIFSCPVHDANSTATYNYFVFVEPKTAWPAGGFRLRFHSCGTGSGTNAQGLAANEGCTVQYAIIKPSQKRATQANWPFSGAPVAITNASNQLILGSGTTTTLNANTPAASSTITLWDGGTSVNAVYGVNKVKIPDSTSQTGFPLRINPGGSFAWDGRSIQKHRQTTAATFTTLVTDYFISCDPTSNAITVNMPVVAACVAGQCFVVKDITGTAATNNITIKTTDSAKIDGVAGSTGYAISTNKASAMIYTNGTDWFIY